MVCLSEKMGYFERVPSLIRLPFGGVQFFLTGDKNDYPIINTMEKA